MLFNFSLLLETGGLLPFAFGGEAFPCPSGISCSFIIADVRNPFVLFIKHRMQAVKIADHPRALVKLPIHRRFPLLAIDRIPAFGEPPPIVLVAARPDELQELAITD